MLFSSASTMRRLCRIEAAEIVARPENAGKSGLRLLRFPKMSHSKHYSSTPARPTSLCYHAQEQHDSTLPRCARVQYNSSTAGRIVGMVEGTNSMRRRLRILFAVAPVALVFYSAAQCMRENYRDVRRWMRSPPGAVDEITAFEARYAPVLAGLPAEGRVGFRLDAPAPAVADTEAYRLKQFYLAQYTLAPRVLDRSVRANANVVDGGSVVAVESASPETVSSLAERPDHLRASQPVAK